MKRRNKILKQRNNLLKRRTNFVKQRKKSTLVHTPLGTWNAWNKHLYM